jgi:alkylation response protein AidB-like acyl-CoA dehydrogenase
MTSKEELLDRVESLLPDIAARTRWVAENGRLHPDTVRDLEAAEIMRTLIPKKYGGFELIHDSGAF